MMEHREFAGWVSPGPTEGPNGFLREANEAHRKRFAAQPPATQQAIEAEARRLGALIAGPDVAWRADFALPASVAVGPDEEIAPIAEERRAQHVGSWMDRLRGHGLRTSLRVHLLRLEQSSDRAVATAAKLIRHATAMWIVRQSPEMPTGAGSSGLSEAPAPPAPDGRASSGSDGKAPVDGRSEGPFINPEWVAFDSRDGLVVDSVAQAESYLGLLQDSLGALWAAISLAPYLVADEVYRARRSGLLGQLAHQSRALARYETREIVNILQRRTLSGQLNRGLKVSLPYYDDQALCLKLRTFDIIPAGRIMFVPALGVRAVQDEQAKVAQDTRLSPATRDHLMEELEMLMRAFRTPHSPTARESLRELQPEASPE
jgi:hypothetical protein